MTPEDQNKKNAQDEINQILFKDFKKFVDQTRVYIAREYITLSLVVGNQRETFALTPYIAKALSYFLSEQVKSHQMEFGGIPFTPPARPDILSPLQQNDLQNPGDGQAPGSSKKDPEDKPKGKPKK